MSKLQTAMDTIVDVFSYYSSKEGDKFKLSKAELRVLLRGELSLEDSRQPGIVEEIMSDLDRNWDGQVSFEEFVGLIARLTIGCSSFFGECTTVYSPGVEPTISNCGQD